MNNFKAYFARLVALAMVLFLSVCGSKGGSPPVYPIETIEELPVAPKPADPLPKTLLADVIAQGVPRAAATSAFDRYEQWRPSVRNGRYVSVIDFTEHSGRPRLFVIDVASAKVDAIHVAHATKSDPNDDGLATAFGNVPDSRKSSLGSYLVAEKYYGKYGASMKLDGLEVTNNTARPRSIVMHPSNYVSESRAKQGRSWGCPAVPYAWISTLIDRLRDGNFMFAYSHLASGLAIDQFEIDQIMLNPAYRWVNEAEEAPFDGE